MAAKPARNRRFRQSHRHRQQRPHREPAYPSKRPPRRGMAEQLLVSTQPYLLSVWLAGVMLLGSRLLLAVVGVRLLTRDRRPVGEELRLLVGATQRPTWFARGSQGVCFAEGA